MVPSRPTRVLAIAMLVGCTSGARSPREPAAPIVAAPAPADANADAAPRLGARARESAGGVPPPDATIASLPVDARVVSWPAVLEHHTHDCSAFPAEPCELVADFDGDGSNDRAVKIRERETRRAGIAIRWGAGGVSLLGAGVELRQLVTDVHRDGIDLSWSVVESDLDFIAGWRVVPRSGTGFTGAGPRRAVGGSDESPAPEAVGAGILIDGGDAAEVIYWDGVRWRRLLLGY